jgi:hypothetical protein
MMFRFAFALALVAGTALLAQAHFVFVVENGTKIIFSDNLEPDTKVSMAKVEAGLKLFARDAAGKQVPVTFKSGKSELTVELPPNTVVVAGSCTYGIIQKGENKPYLLQYFPKTVVTPISTKPTEIKLSEQLPIEVVPVVEGTKLRFRVYADGQPLAKATVAVLESGNAGNKDQKDQKDQKWQSAETDLQGYAPGSYDKPGTYAVRVHRVREVKGTHDGKDYDMAKQYATLVVRFER